MFSGRIQPMSAPQPMPELPQRIWSDDEWERIQLGYASRDMDEKWDVFTEGKVVFLHRSWSGNGLRLRHARVGNQRHRAWRAGDRPP
jgi:hypothetical protein